MAAKRGRIAVLIVLIAAATAGAFERLYAPGQKTPLVERARADDLLDPDLPIATARYHEPTPEELARLGLNAVTPPPEPQVISLDNPPPAADPLRRQMAALPPSVRVKVQAALAARSGPAFQPPEPEILAARMQTSASPRLPGERETLGDQAEALLVRIAPSREDARKGRWFLFAATSGQAFGLNVVRDGREGLRRAGWSVERLASWGKGQIGAGWRKGNVQASLAVAQREIGTLGVKVDDTVAGLTLSLRPHDRPAANVRRARES